MKSWRSCGTCGILFPTQRNPFCHLLGTSRPIRLKIIKCLISHRLFFKFRLNCCIFASVQIYKQYAQTKPNQPWQVGTHLHRQRWGTDLPVRQECAEIWVWVCDPDTGAKPLVWEWIFDYYAGLWQGTGSIWLLHWTSTFRLPEPLPSARLHSVWKSGTLQCHVRSQTILSWRCPWTGIQAGQQDWYCRRF